MSIGPIPPLAPLPVSKTPGKHEEWPIFDVENTARSDDEYYGSGEGRSGKGADDNDQSEFDQQLAAAEEEASLKASNATHPEEEPPVTVSFFA